MIDKPKIKKLTNFPKIIYHGSTTEFQKSLKTIRINVSRKDLDFGQGFYTTSNKNQAIEWAQGKSTSRHKPLLLTYKVNFDIIKELKGNFFDLPNEEWAKLIYKNRVETTDQLAEFDYIYGHLADGFMFKLLEEIKNGSKNFNDFKREIIPENCNFFYYDQLVLKTKRSIEMLTLIKEEVL
ncbi:MAG: DUF3990 domain-containing protein [Halanaerobiales bacterium]|nr:DUF3990 domain-containing protein [Halanaerobiales bacterium]